MNYEKTIFKKENGIAIITLNNPDKLNAFSSKMLLELADELEDVSKDINTKVLILTGTGDRGFCAGADISAVEGGGTDSDTAEKRGVSPIDPIGTELARIRFLDKPTIAAVNGIAAGGGAAIATACDIRIASDKARFGAFFVKRSATIHGGLSYFLPAIVGPAKALELMYTGDIIDAKEGERIGLFTKVVPHENLMNEAKTLAKKIASAPPLMLSHTKRQVYSASQNDLKTQLMCEAFALGEISKSEDAKEGYKAFLEKREPVYQGK
ncbi:enoyl-CoA hydratase/isomerase family protein [Chloroflexota bacterium]